MKVMKGRKKCDNKRDRGKRGRKKETVGDYKDNRRGVQSRGSMEDRG